MKEPNAAAQAMAPASAAVTALPRRARGRRKGSTVATFANLNKLTIQDFAFVRGILSGMEPEAAFKRFYANRYFDADGNVAVHGHTVTAVSYTHLERRNRY